MRALLALLLLSACPAPRSPRTQPVAAATFEIGRDGASLHGVASDGSRLFAALTTGGETSSVVIEARVGDRVAWSRVLAGQGGALAASRAPSSSSSTVFAALGGKAAAGVTLRGEPGAVVVALDGATGSEKWKLTLDASEWSVISSIAPFEDGIVVGGTFGGTLRAGSKIVSSAGAADGFVARIGGSGEVAWLVRVGGVAADGVHGVATAGDRIAIAGTFAAGADLLGEPLRPYDEKTPRADGFVAELDASGARRWTQTFGGKLDDSVAGVAIDGAGRVAVAASVRAVMKIGSAEFIALGDGDGAVAWWSKDGVPLGAVQLGGMELDGVRAIAAAGTKIVVGGVFSGTMKIGPHKLTAGGGDDAYLAAFENGTFVDLWPVTGEGREEIAALAAMPGGFVAGITHTARAEVRGVPLAAPAGRAPAPDAPASSAALVVRAVN